MPRRHTSTTMSTCLLHGSKGLVGMCRLNRRSLDKQRHVRWAHRCHNEPPSSQTRALLLISVDGIRSSASAASPPPHRVGLACLIFQAQEVLSAHSPALAARCVAIIWTRTSIFRSRRRRNGSSAVGGAATRAGRACSAQTGS